MSDVFPIENESCNHPFDTLSTTEERYIICSSCGYSTLTGSQDAFELLFLSTAIKISSQDDKISNLENFIINNFGNAICTYCDAWIDRDEPETGLKLLNIWTCVEHITLAINDLEYEDIMEEITDWIKSSGFLLSTNIYNKLVLEELYATIPNLKNFINTIEIEKSETVLLDPILVNSLNLIVPITVDDIITGMSKALDVAEKVNLNYSRPFLLGIVSGCDKYLKGEFNNDLYFEDSFDSQADIIYNKIAENSLFPLQINRIKAYVEILGEDMPDIFTVDGDMVDQLLLMTAARGAETLLSTIILEEDSNF